MRSPRVLIVGDVVNDIVVKPASPVTVSSDTRATIVTCPGGSAANQAAWLAHLGGQVAFVGRVGAADVAWHQQRFVEAGVAARLAADADVDTGTIVILVDGAGDRTMYVDGGANLRLQQRDIPDGALEGIALLHLTGYSFMTAGPRSAVLDLIARAARRGIPFSLDPSSAAFIREVGPTTFLRWTEGAILCFPNRDEAAVLTGMTTPSEMARSLLSHYETAVLKLGPQGVLVQSRGAAPIAIPADATDALDTTGAGDAFCGAFLYHWMAGSSAEQAARGAIAMAARAVTQIGARPVHHQEVVDASTGGSSSVSRSSA